MGVSCSLILRMHVCLVAGERNSGHGRQALACPSSARTKQFEMLQPQYGQSHQFIPLRLFTDPTRVFQPTLASLRLSAYPVPSWPMRREQYRRRAMLSCMSSTSSQALTHSPMWATARSNRDVGPSIHNLTHRTITGADHQVGQF